jgi:hypothetical protein
MPDLFGNLKKKVENDCLKIYPVYYLKDHSGTWKNKRKNYCFKIYFKICFSRETYYLCQDR